MAQLPRRTIMGRLRLTVVVAVLLLAACGTETAAGPRGSGGSPGPAPGDPLELVGLWSVREAAGEEPGAILRLGESMSLWRVCGHLDGAWRATVDGLFVDHVYGGSGACYQNPDSVPGWLREAAGHRTDGPDRLLVDRAGRTLARLVPSGRPKVDAYTAPSEGEPPVVTAALRRMLSPAAPLPTGLTPVSDADLVRRWVPSDGAGARVPRPPFVELRADGGWGGSDGCNGQGGRWVAGSAGSFLAVAGAQTAIGCNGVDVGGWLAGASRAGMAGDELVLLDRAGHELGRLRPA
jgi:hypothetical protein